MEGYKILLANGDIIHLPNASYWFDKGDKLDMKESKDGEHLARFGWDNIIGVYDADDMRRVRGNTNG